MNSKDEPDGIGAFLSSLISSLVSEVLETATPTFTPATRVGINSIGPAFTLDVDGDSNVTGTVRQGGVSLSSIVSGDATALAIALG